MEEDEKILLIAEALLATEEEMKALLYVKPGDKVRSLLDELEKRGLHIVPIPARERDLISKRRIRSIRFVSHPGT